VKRLLPLLMPVLAVCGCATSTVTLLPGEAGSPVGAVAVVDQKSGADVQVIDTAGSAAVINGRSVAVTAGDPAAAEARNAELLAGLPAAAKRFILYFPTGSDDITAESIPERDRMLAEVKARGDGVSVQIEGHTDRVGGAARNLQLSKERADAARDMLVKLGLKTEFTRTVGRGELAPVPGHATAEGVADPINRRVEVIVR
jgi:outer membrane protein OmpA-like peptidoglycan-associated protein